MKSKAIIVLILLIICLIVLGIISRARYNQAFFNLNTAYPSTPEKVISAYLEAHGNGDRGAAEMFLSEKQKDMLNKPNVFWPTKPIFKTLQIQTIKEESKGNERFQKYRDNEHIKVYWVEWYAELTEYGEKNYSHPSGKMSSYFFLIKDSNSHWKIEDWGY